MAVASSDLADFTGLTQTQIAQRKTQLEALAQDYVDANYEAAGGDSDDIDVSVTISDGVITVDGTHARGTTFTRIAGFEDVDVGAHAEVNMEDGAIAGVELAMVMDTTGSMADNNKPRDEALESEAQLGLQFSCRTWSARGR